MLNFERLLKSIREVLAPLTRTRIANVGVATASRMRRSLWSPRLERVSLSPPPPEPALSAREFVPLKDALETLNGILEHLLISNQEYARIVQRPLPHRFKVALTKLEFGEHAVLRIQFL